MKSLERRVLALENPGGRKDGLDLADLTRAIKKGQERARGSLLRLGTERYEATLLLDSIAWAKSHTVASAQTAFEKRLVEGRAYALKHGTHYLFEKWQKETNVPEDLAKLCAQSETSWREWIKSEGEKENEAA